MTKHQYTLVHVTKQGIRVEKVQAWTRQGALAPYCDRRLTVAELKARKAR